MAENSKIEWTDHTFNPWIGCTKVHAGCTNCYAEADFDKRKHFANWGPNGTRIVTTAANWKKPIAWNKQAHKDGIRRKVFCASLADVFEDWSGPMTTHDGYSLWQCRKCGDILDGAVPSIQCSPPTCTKRGCMSTGSVTEFSMKDARNRLFSLIDETPNLDWLLLTKRPENIRRMTPLWEYHACITGDCPHDRQSDCDLSDAGYRDNVWIGTSISDQASADKQIPELLKCRDLSPVLFLSAEPLLGPIDIDRYLWPFHPDGRAKFEYPLGLIKQVIVGGESGPDARPMHPDWARGLRDQCQAAGVPFFFKQWGEWLPHSQSQYRGSHWSDRGHKFDDDNLATWYGKKAAGRRLDGREWNEFPAVESEAI